MTVWIPNNMEFLQQTSRDGYQGVSIVRTRYCGERCPRCKDNGRTYHFRCSSIQVPTLLLLKSRSDSNVYTNMISFPLWSQDKSVSVLTGLRAGRPRS